MANSSVSSRQRGNLGILDFNVDVGAQSYESAFRAQNDLMRAQVSAFAFNFTESKYITSTGIGLIITLVESAQQAKRPVYAYGLTSHYARIFTMAGLWQNMSLYISEQDILDKVKADAPAPVSSVSSDKPIKSQTG